MDLMQIVDDYCERLEPGLWAEPLNLLSNLAFLISALYLLYLAGRSYSPRALVPKRTFQILAWIIFSVGIGSGIFHSVARVWAMWADVIPIGIFLFSYLGVFLRFVCGYRFRGIAVGMGAFLILNVLFGLYMDPVWSNNSQQYFATVIALLGMGFWMQNKGWVGGGFLYAGAVLFSLSLVFRSVDMAVCPSFPVGTHFLWHITNAIVLTLVMQGLLGLVQRETNY